MRLADAVTITRALTPGGLEAFSRHLDPDWIEEALLSTGTATIRRRRLPAEQAVWLVIGMALLRDLPIKDVVARLGLALPDKRGSRGVATSTVMQARARLGPEPMQWLFARTAAEWAHASAARHRFHDLAVYGVDGTTLRVPDSDENRSHFGGQSAGKGRGESGYPILRIAALMALRSHLIVNVDFGPYRAGEQPYAATLWSQLPDHSLTLVDRGFLQANVLVPLAHSGTDRHWLTRAKSTTKWRVLERLGANDFLAEMDVSSTARKQDPSLPPTFRVRVTHYQRKGFRPQTLLSSLLDPERFPAGEIRDLYHERWELELAYDEIKTTVLQRQETIRSKSPASVAQELFGIFLAYNLVRLEMQRIADELDLPPTRISFVAAARDITDAWYAAALIAPDKIPALVRDLRDQLRTYVLPPRRPERLYPRAVKLKMSNYPRKRPPLRRGPAK